MEAPMYPEVLTMLGLTVLFGAAVLANHWLAERRWARERAVEQAARAAE